VTDIESDSMMDG